MTTTTKRTSDLRPHSITSVLRKMPPGRARARAVRAAAIKRGVSLAAIARSLGVTRQAVSAVLRGWGRSQKIEAELQRLFPAEVAKYPFGAEHR